MSQSNSDPGDVHTLIEAVKAAKRCKLEYEAAQDALGAATDRVRDLIGGDGLAAISNGERRVGEILTRLEDEAAG